jgi:hypothetical protein
MSNIRLISNGTYSEGYFGTEKPKLLNGIQIECI